MVILARFAELARRNIGFQAGWAVLSVLGVLRFFARLAMLIVLDAFVVVHGCCSLSATAVSGWNKQYGENGKRTDYRQRENKPGKAAPRATPRRAASVAGL